MPARKGENGEHHARPHCLTAALPHTRHRRGRRAARGRYQQQVIKTALRGLVAAALVVLPLAPAPPAHAAETVPLAIAIDRLTPGTESQEGYQRTSFKHWKAGPNPTDGCSTRAGSVGSW
jgi:hypothetical protein